jgi:maltooligosyltrehalose trehalohydrolase
LIAHDSHSRMIDYQLIRPSALGATRCSSGGWQFAVWAPQREKVELHLQSGRSQYLPMQRHELGYFHATVAEAEEGSTYFYRLDGGSERPDPASRFQPEGVHSASQLVDVAGFPWSDADWRGPSLEDSVFYELHVGTFTAEGTFAALTAHLDRFADLGVTSIELMPIAQFPGGRNWGYDGVFPFAAQNTYGSPRDLQKFVNEAHARGLAVALDVVYNHLGPEGNYLSEYGPYFTDHYRTPWGAALNFDGPQSDEVRFFFIQSALYWLERFHIDALRLDAIHGIFDASAFPFLAEMSTAVAALSTRLNRKIHLIAESDLNDARTITPTERFGIGMDAQWSDDFHHSVHTLLTRENFGYYADFGDIHHLAETIRNGWYYSGQYSRYRQRKFGNTSAPAERSRFVVCNQNHDQVGNRALGERLSRLVSFESLKLAAGITVLSCFVPLLFMGEEYGETASFLYFTSHGDPELAAAVRRGREAEFARFRWLADVPDPQAESTFASSKLDHSLASQEPHRTLQRFYKVLLQFRRARRLAEARQIEVTEYPDEQAVLTLCSAGSTLVAALFHFGDGPATLTLELPPGIWERRIDSADPEWLGQQGLPAKMITKSPATLNVQGRSLIVLECSRPLTE